MTKKKPSRLLTIFLAKAGIKKAAQILKNLGKLGKHQIKVKGSRIGDLYVQPSSVRPPRWISLFDGALDVDRLPLKVASARAVLLVPKSKRLFALAFGQGRHLLSPGSFEENFGLRATLNSVDPDRVRVLERKRFDAISRLAREQASREVPIFDFGLELEQDMLRSLTGPPRDSRLGKRLSGKDSLSVAVPLTLADLDKQLHRYLKQWEATDYKKAFPWVDNIKQVREKALQVDLDGRLLAKLRSRDFAGTWLAVPELLDWEDIEGFRYGRRKTTTLHPDLHLAQYMDQLPDSDSLTVPRLRQHRVFCISASTDEVLRDWSIYKCLYAELDTESGTFILDNGRWYRVDTDLRATVDSEIGKIPKSKLALPPYSDSEDEKDYNKRVASADKASLALMDRQLIPCGGGRSRVEFCDLYSKTRIMIHVKRYGGSNTLSYLFSQGAVSATALLWDETFRKALNQKLPVAHRLANPAIRPKPEQFEVAFAIASRSSGDLKLPFFSRVTLRNVHRQLSNYGFKVTCTKIPVT